MASMHYYFDYFLSIFSNVVEMDSDSESVESWDGEALGEEECLFCSHVSDSLETNVQHMTSAHSFFIPDVEYLTDLPGLIGYLGMESFMLQTT